MRFSPRGSSAGIGTGALFVVSYIVGVSAVYFGLGVVAKHALGLTPVVFLLAGLFFGITLMAYAEGSSVHIERGGASSFARYALNEFWSFVAGWAILLDYVILLALIAAAVPDYLAPISSHFNSHAGELLIPVGLIAVVAWLNIRGVTAASLRRVLPVGVLDLGIQFMLIILGLAFAWNPSSLVDTVDLWATPTGEGFIVALILATVSFAGIETAAGLAGEIRISRRGLKATTMASTGSIVAAYAGLSFVALMAAPVMLTTDGNAVTSLGTVYEEAPLLAIPAGFDSALLGDLVTYLIAAVAVLTLTQAARIAMLGPVRLTYALATHSQIPRTVGRLHPTFGTPIFAIVVIAGLAALLTLTDDLEFMISIYAFGAMITFAIAHLSICVLRYREPDAKPAYSVPWSVKIGGGRLPIPAAAAFVMAVAGWIAVIAYRPEARLVGGAWMLGGLLLYVLYRRSSGNSLTRRVDIAEEDLRQDTSELKRVGSYGSILVPVFGGVLDDDIIGTAGRLAMEESGDEGGSVIEALHVIEVPMTQPIDAPVPAERLREARRILARAKEVGEEYRGVEVATATVRARATGEAIVREAVRRGVEAIVLAAERPTRIRSGVLLGGLVGAKMDFVGKVTEYVTRKAPCRVVLTAPPEHDAEALAESINENSYFRAAKLRPARPDGMAPTPADGLPESDPDDEVDHR